MDALFPYVQECFAAAADNLVELILCQVVRFREGFRILADVEDILALEVAVGGHSVVAAENFTIGVTQDGANLVRCPNEEFPFHTFAVRVLGRIEAAGRVGHLL